MNSENGILLQIFNNFVAQSWLEFVAVITAIFYLVLAARENIWCWFYGFISTAIYMYLFFDVSLLSESVLNFYYLIMSVYGWWQWSNNKKHEAILIRRWSLKHNIILIICCIVLVIPVGFLMHNLGASFPYIDALVALLAIVATWMTAKKIYENWYYWLFIDSVSIYLFIAKQLYLTAVLFIIYVVLIFFGIYSWKKLMKQQSC